MTGRTRVVASPDALYGVRRARRAFRCDGLFVEPEEQHMIEPGDLYVASALPPHSDVDNMIWWHARYCVDCAPDSPLLDPLEIPRRQPDSASSEAAGVSTVEPPARDGGAAGE